MANEKLHNLEVVDMMKARADKLMLSEAGMIHFKNVKRFSLATSPLSGNFPATIPLKFDRLEEMSFGEWVIITETFIRFTKEQHKLGILTILRGFNGLNLQKWISIIESLPQLGVIRTCWFTELEVDGIAGVMTRKTNLKKIIFDF